MFDLGIEDPAEIDLEAVAWSEGVTVKYRTLEGCEARIIGRGDRAIISVNDRSPLRRQRFSIGHELGHWRHHRGRALFCRASDIGLRSTFRQNDVELVANKFGADLLMPGYLFDRVARSFPKWSFAAVGEIANSFKVSRSAAAIRLVQRGHITGLLICHDNNGRKWFFRSPDLPDRWFPRADLDADSSAFAVQFGRSEGTPHPTKVGAEAWFDRFDAAHYEVREQSTKYTGGCSLTIVQVDDPKMLRE